MASGYTQEVLSGNVNTLKEFASVCAKGFGATSHQQKEALNTPLREMVVGKENKKSIRALKSNLKKFNAITNKELIADELKALETTKEHYLGKVVLMKEAKKKCSALLLDVQLWTPPTENHIVVKEMMEEHLKSTIEFDCDLDSVNQLLEDIESKMGSIDPEAIRKKQVEAIEQQIDFHEQSHKVDVDHVKQSNEWVGELMDSFE
jgi:hypothetical protein